MHKVLLYYKFVPVNDPETVKFWQRNLCQRLNLKGRIIISKHGINGTVGGKLEDCKMYIREMNEHPLFKNIQYKRSDGTGEDFPKLSVKVRPELVAFGAPDEVEVDDGGVVGGGKHLKPDQVHKLVEERGDEVLFFDGRNMFEAAVGKFKNTIVPKVETSRDFLAEIEKPEYNEIKDRPIVTYCTGGIRCEILSALMIKRGFKEVYQIDGGIVKYGEKFGDDGLWEGSLYIFDNRKNQRFSDKSIDIGECIHCQGKTSKYENCAHMNCNKQVLICENCDQLGTCSKACEAKVAVKTN